MKADSRIFNKSVVRGLKLFALTDALGVVLTGGINLPDTSALYHVFMTEAYAETITVDSVTQLDPVPEMPLMMVPVLIVMTFVALRAIRKNCQASLYA